MKKFIVVLFSLVLLVLFLKHTGPEPVSYILQPNSFSKPVKVEAKAKVIFLSLGESLFIKNNKSHCLQKVLFFNFKTGYVNCGHSMTDTVYYTYGNENLPEKMHFSTEELRLY